MRAETSFRILVAEDNAADVTLVQEALNEENLRCELNVVRDGGEAVDFIEGLDRDPALPRLDLVLLDMRLPKRDGEQILKRLRCTEHYAQTPVIIMTSSDSPMDQENAQKHAAVHYFKKPSSLEEFMHLGTIVRQSLERRMTGVVLPVTERSVETA